MRNCDVITFQRATFSCAWKCEFRGLILLKLCRGWWWWSPLHCAYLVFIFSKSIKELADMQLSEFWAYFTVTMENTHMQTSIKQKQPTKRTIIVTISMNIQLFQIQIMLFRSDSRLKMMNFMALHIDSNWMGEGVAITTLNSEFRVVGERWLLSVCFGDMGIYARSWPPHESPKADSKMVSQQVTHGENVAFLGVKCIEVLIWLWLIHRS